MDDIFSFAHYGLKYQGDGLFFNKGCPKYTDDQINLIDVSHFRSISINFSGFLMPQNYRPKKLIQRPFSLQNLLSSTAPKYVTCDLICAMTVLHTLEYWMRLFYKAFMGQAFPFLVQLDNLENY